MADTRAIWTSRVENWRASGLKAEEYVVGQGYAASTLKWWEYRLRKTAAVPVVRVAQVVRTSEETRGDRGAVIIEGPDRGVRITIERGVDRETIATVLATVYSAQGSR